MGRNFAAKILSENFSLSQNLVRHPPYPTFTPTFIPTFIAAFNPTSPTTHPLPSPPSHLQRHGLKPRPWIPRQSHVHFMAIIILKAGQISLPLSSLLCFFPCAQTLLSTPQRLNTIPPPLPPLFCSSTPMPSPLPSSSTTPPPSLTPSNWTPSSGSPSHPSQLAIARLYWSVRFKSH